MATNQEIIAAVRKCIPLKSKSTDEVSKKPLGITSIFNWITETIQTNNKRQS